MQTSPTCRHCHAPLTRTLVDLGMSPLANSYVKPENAGVKCPEYELHVRVCDTCFLVQVEDAVPAGDIFSEDYAYFSSFSESWLAHCHNYVDTITNQLKLDSDDLVIEIASNDGYLLQYFVERGIPVLGIEPAAGVANAAIEKGVPTRIEYFDSALAKQLVAEGLRPSLVASANVLAHVPDINDFVGGIATLLDDNAVWTVEFPHLLNLIEKVQFDTIYHEHYTYLSLLTLETIFAAAGLRVFDLETLPTHGGSLRLYICQQEADRTERPIVEGMRKKERQANLDNPKGYDGFDDKVREIRQNLLTFMRAAKQGKRSIAAYGAAAKGNTLLNYCGITSDDILYCVDRNPAKQNKLLPGSHIPVSPVERLREERPDFVLILPWNLRDEIAVQLSDLAEQGTQFVVPIPSLEIFSR
ncbi:class I SAM-dependent methyltransferase [Ruegeria sp. HKCCD7255]|uniref:class I SAM-dependent methyltransferase n=1 Tax=Ruegeria sp. HKCCD7255 TaxID=2683004 RepID=UPI0014878E68|nr:class I SAM-dependent methyltransferase [Ruegeria sp. HKCCD7255]